MDTAQLITLEDQHSSGFYHKQPLVIARGQGARIWDAEGREYIDCTSGYGVSVLGHCHPAVVGALSVQARQLITCSETFYNERRAALQARLAGIAPPGLGRVFLCNSGTEAIEAALKIARLVTGRQGFVAAKNGFHGRTMGSLSATWKKQYREPFEPLVPGFQHVAYNDIDGLAQTVTPGTAAVLLEVIQGEGGVVPGDAAFLLAAQRLCREQGALLIVDEVQTGFGRTGRMFACQHHGLQPDLLCLAKGIAGGLPMGAVLMRTEWDALPAGTHGSTFGGNPLVCAAALACIDAVEQERLPERAAELGDHFMDQLRAMDSPLVREVRGLGLMVGMQLKRRAGPYLSMLMERGVLALAAGPTVMRFLPPLVISRGDLDTVVRTVGEVLAMENDSDG